MARRGLYANINARKKAGTSRPKSKSTISKKAYANMKAGFPKKKNMRSRNYKAEYRKYQSSTKSKLDRASRNRARRRLARLGAVSKGDGKDIDHRNKNPRDNSMSNLRVTSKKLNRGRYRVS